VEGLHPWLAALEEGAQDADGTADVDDHFGQLDEEEHALEGEQVGRGVDNKAGGAGEQVGQGHRAVERQELLDFEAQ
jgi:hypothetical protein